MASLEHRRERMHSAPSKALRAGRVCHVQLCTCQSPLLSPVALTRLSAGRCHTQAVPSRQQELKDGILVLPHAIGDSQGPLSLSVPSSPPGIWQQGGGGREGKRERLREVEASFWPTPTKNSYSKCQQKSPCAIHNSIPVSLSHHFSPPSGLHLNIRFLSINVFPS